MICKHHGCFLISKYKGGSALFCPACRAEQKGSGKTKRPRLDAAADVSTPAYPKEA